MALSFHKYPLTHARTKNTSHQQSTLSAIHEEFGRDGLNALIMNQLTEEDPLLNMHSLIEVRDGVV